MKLIRNNYIDIWQADLSDNHIQKLWYLIDCLDDKESNKAAQFRYDSDRRNYVLSHIVLRLLLSKYTGISPNLVTIHTSKYGKPYVNFNDFEFNLSHAKSQLAIAFSSCDVGIDVEYIDDKINIHDLFDQVLSNKERMSLDNCTADKRKQFYTFWTKKESYLKGIGTGIDLELSQIDMSCSNKIDYFGNGWIIKPLKKLSLNYTGSVAFRADHDIEIKYQDCMGLLHEYVKDLCLS